MVHPLIRYGDDIFVSQEGQGRDSEAGGEDGRYQPVNTRAAGAHRHNLVSPGKKKQGKDAGEQDSEGDRKYDELWNSEEEKKKAVGEGGFLFDKVVNPLDEFSHQKKSDSPGLADSDQAEKLG
jgi:hypothetical protein